MSRLFGSVLFSGRCFKIELKLVSPIEDTPGFRSRGTALLVDNTNGVELILRA